MSSIDFMFSERQQKILQALILRDGLAFSLSDLIRIAGPGHGATQRILEQFETAGVVKKTSRGNQKLYQVNKTHPIYPELRTICLKTFGLAEIIAEELEPFGTKIEKAFIFGSLAKGEERPDSDVDLMIVGDVDYFDMGETLDRLKAKLGREIDLNLHSPADWATLRNDRVINAINNEQKIMVAGR